MKAPPLLPDETLARVLRTANMDGISVMAIAGFLALASASMGDLYGAGIGLLVAAAGAIELHGAGLLRAGDARGLNWILTSQPYLLVVLLGYCGLRFLSFDPSLLKQAITDDMRLSIAQAGYREDEFVRIVYFATYGLLALGATVFQGGMALYYWRRREAVRAAVEGEELE
jgi:hypothetical protein